MTGFSMPTDPPPVLFAHDFGSDSPRPIGLPPGASVEDRQLRFSVDAPTTAVGFPLGNRPFGDVALQVRLGLIEGEDDDLYGIFVRRPVEGPRQGRFACFMMGPGGRVAVWGYDGQAFHPVIDGPLGQGLTFAPGRGDSNLFQAVVAGPQVTFFLNQAVIIGLSLDLPLSVGEVGVFVHHGATSARATIGVDWVHVSALMAPNVYR